MSTIGIFHYKVGGTDGVSLEIDKWKRVLEEMGHTVHLCAGDIGTVEGTLIEEMYHHRPEAERLNYNTFCQLRDYDGEAAYKAEMERVTQAIEPLVGDHLDGNEIAPRAGNDDPYFCYFHAGCVYNWSIGQLGRPILAKIGLTTLPI